jgi:hypothetical protein
MASPVENSRKKPDVYRPGHPAPIEIFRQKAPDAEGMEEPEIMIAINWDRGADAWRVDYPGGFFYLGAQ